MSKFILFVIVVCGAYLFFCGIRRVLRSFSSSGSCGCGEEQCTCGKDSDKLPSARSAQSALPSETKSCCCSKKS